MSRSRSGIRGGNEDVPQSGDEVSPSDHEGRDDVLHSQRVLVRVAECSELTMSSVMWIGGMSEPALLNLKGSGLEDRQLPQESLLGHPGFLVGSVVPPC